MCVVQNEQLGRLFRFGMVQLDDPNFGSVNADDGRLVSIIVIGAAKYIDDLAIGRTLETLWENLIGANQVGQTVSIQILDN